MDKGLKARKSAASNGVWEAMGLKYFNYSFGFRF
jgi:hypothetical protein